MNIYFFIYLFIILFGWVANTIATEKSKKYYIVCCILIFLLLNSLRSLTIGSDTENYYHMFLSTIDKSWSEVWSELVGRYYYGISEEDIGYVVFVKLLGYLTHDYHVFTFIAESLFFVPLGVFLYKYSRNCWQLIFAFTLYGALLNAIPITNCRQTYAFGLCIITVIMYIEDFYRKFIPLVIVAAATIHLSALLFFLPYVLVRFPKMYRKLHVWALLLVPIVLADPNTIIRFMGNMVGKEQYAGYGSNAVVGGTDNFVMMLELLSLYVLFAYRRVDFNQLEIKNKLLYCMAPLFTFLGPLIASNGTMIRISMYFHVFLVLLIPEATSQLSKKNEAAINMIMVLVLVYLSLSKSGDYFFFWEIDSPLTW